MEERIETRLMLRLPETLRQRVEQSASRNRRSMNSEIVVILERELENAPVAKSAEGRPE